MKEYQTKPAPISPWDQGGPIINGPPVHGARRDNWTVCPLAVTGQRPLVFSANKLPKGFEINPATGVIQGRSSSEGVYDVDLTVTNTVGRCEQPMRIIIGEKISLTPPMGWNSWNCWAEEITDEIIRTSARQMVSSGLAAHGYSYVNIDAGWQGERGGAFNAIQGNKQFPDMAGLCAYIHSLGLRAGIYSTPWVKSYCSLGEGFTGGSSGPNSGVQSPLANHIKEKKYIGEVTHEAEDSRQWAEWGFDYLKYDWITNDVPTTRRMADALRSCGRDIVYSISNNAPFEYVQHWAELSNCWRITGDITDTWESVCHNGFMKEKWMPYAGPGHWCDPDMLVVGRLGWGSPRECSLSANEQISHITLWALLCAPLLVGCDLTRLDDFTLRLLCNDEVIAVNQDVAGIPATCIQDLRVHHISGSLLRHETIYAKSISDGSLVVGVFNRGEDPARVHVDFRQLNRPGSQSVYNIWSREPLGFAENGFDIGIAPHGAQLLRLS